MTGPGSPSIEPTQPAGAAEPIEPGELMLTRAADRLALLRLAGAVRAAFDRSAMIYTDGDLALWIDRWMVAHHHRLTVTALPEGGLRFSEGDAAAWAALRRAAEQSRFA